jgi:hypothetical protein
MAAARSGAGPPGSVDVERFGLKRSLAWELATRRVREVEREKVRRVALTPGCQAGYMDHTGCHVDHTGCHVDHTRCRHLVCSIICLTRVVTPTPGGCQIGVTWTTIPAVSSIACVF